MKAVVRDTSLYNIVISINKILGFKKIIFKYFLAKKYPKLKFHDNKQSQTKYSAFGFVIG